MFELERPPRSSSSISWLNGKLRLREGTELTDLGVGHKTPGSQDVFFFFFSLEPEFILLYVAWIDYSLSLEYYKESYFCSID